MPCSFMRALPRTRVRLRATAARARARALTRWLADAEGLPLDGTRSLTFCHDRQDKTRLAAREKRARTLRRGDGKQAGGYHGVHLMTRRSSRCQNVLKGRGTPTEKNPSSFALQLLQRHSLCCPIRKNAFLFLHGQRL